jgi:hypothetical protein
MQGCSGDGFFYFQPWLVGLGHETFERVAGNPDSLAGVPQIHRLADRRRSDWSDDEWPEWERLNYVALNAYSTTPWMHKVSIAPATSPPRTTAGTTTIPVRDSQGSRASPHSWANTGQIPLMTTTPPPKNGGL